MKNIIAILLFVLPMTAAANMSWDEKALEVKIIEVGGYDHDEDSVEEMKDFKGSLMQFYKKYGGDGTEGKLKFKVERNKDWFKNARRIGKHAWVILTNGLRTEIVGPNCGYISMGDIEITEKKASNGYIYEYTADGTGDGGMNTCTGQGGPGWWHYKVSVKYSAKSNRGTIEYITVSE